MPVTTQTREVITSGPAPVLLVRFFPNTENLDGGGSAVGGTAFGAPTADPAAAVVFGSVAPPTAAPGPGPWLCWDPLRLMRAMTSLAVRSRPTMAWRDTPPS